MESLYLVVLIAVTLVALYVIFGSFFTVSTAQVAVITRFGKFLRVAEAGLNWKSPFFDSVAGTRQPARQSDHPDHGNQDQGQRVRDHSDLGPESRAPRKSLTTPITSWPIRRRRSSPTSSRSSSATFPA